MSVKFEFRQKFVNIAWNVLMLKCCFKLEMQIKLGILYFILYFYGEEKRGLLRYIESKSKYSVQDAQDVLEVQVVKECPRMWGSGWGIHVYPWLIHVNV